MSELLDKEDERQLVSGRGRRGGESDLAEGGSDLHSIVGNGLRCCCLGFGRILKDVGHGVAANLVKVVVGRDLALAGDLVRGTRWLIGFVARDNGRNQLVSLEGRGRRTC